MKIPRGVSGERLAQVLCRHWHYVKVHQSGSHIILETSEPFPQRVSVPNHDAIRVGTFNSILRTVSDHKRVTREAIITTL